MNNHPTASSHPSLVRPDGAGHKAWEAFPYNKPGNRHELTGVWYITDGRAKIIADGLTQDNAELIVTAVNSHAAHQSTLTALEGRVKELEGALNKIAKFQDYDERDPLGIVQDLARTALARQG